MNERQPNIKERFQFKAMEVKLLVLRIMLRLRWAFIGKADREQKEQNGDLGLSNEYKKNPDESIKDYLKRLKREFQSKEEQAYIDLLVGLALVWAYAEDKLKDSQPSSVNDNNEDNGPSVIINRDLQSVMLYSLNRMIAIFENKYQASLRGTKEASRRNTFIKNFISSLEVVRKSFSTSDQKINIDFDDFIVNSTRIQADAVLVDLEVPPALLGELKDYFKKLIDEGNRAFFNFVDSVLNNTDDS